MCVHIDILVGNLGIQTSVRGLEMTCLILQILERYRNY